MIINDDEKNKDEIKINKSHKKFKKIEQID